MRKRLRLSGGEALKGGVHARLETSTKKSKPPEEKECSGKRGFNRGGVCTRGVVRKRAQAD